MSNFKGFMVTILIMSLLMGAAPVDAALFNLDSDQVEQPEPSKSSQGGSLAFKEIDTRVEYRYNGFAKFKNEYWAVEDGILAKEKTGLVKGEIGGENTWWYVEGGKVNFSADTMAKNKDGWWKVTNGKIDPSFTGIAKNTKGYWYLTEGRLNYDFCDIVEKDGEEWLVVRGKASRITKANDMTLYRAFKLLDKITTDKMTKEEKLKACWDYVQKQEEINTRIPHYTGMDWPMIYAEDIFMNKEGNCISFAAALCYMAKALGYKEVYACHSGEHGWAEIDGLIYDPEWALHHDEYNYYGISYEEETDQNYGETISYSDEEGCEWMRIKI